MPDHLYRIIIVGDSGPGKTSTLFMLINKQNDIDKVYLYARDLSETKYEYLIQKREDVGIKHANNPNAFTEPSNTINDVYENMEIFMITLQAEKEKS